MVLVENIVGEHSRGWGVVHPESVRIRDAGHLPDGRAGGGQLRTPADHAPGNRVTPGLSG